MSTRILQPPSSLLLKACDAVESVIVAVLDIRREISFGKYESHTEACLLFNLVIRHIEGVLTIARTDTVMIPPAFVCARAAFETSIKAAWLVNAEDPFDREARWLVHLAEEERTLTRLIERSQEGKLRQMHETHLDSLRTFRDQVQRLMPTHIAMPSGNPSLEASCRSIGGENSYWTYVYLSQFVHGCHFATSLYRKNLGTEKIIGDYVHYNHWYIALKMCWLSLSHPANIVYSRILGKSIQLHSLEKQCEVEAAIEALLKNDD